MIERFTERAQRAMVLATEEARRRRHETVGPEHLLLGILLEGGCLDLRVMADPGAPRYAQGRGRARPERSARITLER
jgi:ATP-dependent Clp protease ATP-binding subunit ClpA